MAVRLLSFLIETRPKHLDNNRNTNQGTCHMDFNFDRIASNISRQVASFEQDSKPLRKVLLSCDLAETKKVVWESLTDPEKLGKWFQHVTGDLKLGGRFQIHDNAAGTVVSCKSGESFSITWEFAGDVSWVDVSLVALEHSSVRLSISHTMNFSEHWTHYGPGATGVGWELSLYGLAFFLLHPDEQKFDEMEFVSSPMGKSTIEESSEGWAQADITSGTSREHAQQAAHRTVAFYTGDEVD